MKLSAQVKTEVGKSINRRLRRDGKVPAVIYGQKQDPIPIILDQKEVEKILSSGGQRRLQDLYIADLGASEQSTQVMFKDIQRNAITDEIIHIDFYSVRKGHKLSVLVPVKLTGQAIGVDDGGGVLQFLTREIAVECLPKDLPEYLEVEISDLELGQSLSISDIELPEGITCADELAKTIVSVVTVAAPILEDEEDEESEEEASEEETSEEAKKE